MKKYLEDKYQQLINDMERAYAATIDTLNYHINKLQKTVIEQEDELDKLKGGDKLAEEIAQIAVDNNAVTTVDSCPGCDTRIKELTEENKKLKAKLEKKPKATRRRHKNVLCMCADCKKYFYARRKDARRCPECKRVHGNELKKAWYKNHSL